MYACGWTLNVEPLMKTNRMVNVYHFHNFTSKTICNVCVRCTLSYDPCILMFLLFCHQRRNGEREKWNWKCEMVACDNSNDNDYYDDDVWWLMVTWPNNTCSIHFSQATMCSGDKAIFSSEKYIPNSFKSIRVLHWIELYGYLFGYKTLVIQIIKLSFWECIHI